MSPEERALAIVDLVELTGLNAEEYLSVKAAIVSAIQAAEEPIKKDRDAWFSRCRVAQQANEFAETRIRVLESALEEMVNYHSDQDSWQYQVCKLHDMASAVLKVGRT